MVKKTVLIAPNSFKECCSSAEATELIFSNLKDHGLDLIKIPISDGGDGFLECIKLIHPNHYVRYYNIRIFSDDLMNIPVVISDDILYIESADVIGLKLVKPEKRNPLNLNTMALGELLQLIESDNKSGFIRIKKVVIGIGGTATNDLGLGAAHSFGLKLIDIKNNKIPIHPAEYKNAVRIELKHVKLSFILESVLDVNSPLTGEYGAANIFARQKGASSKDIQILEQGFINILDVLNKQQIIDTSSRLSGAGGGLAAGLKIFMGARIKTSEDFILEDLNLRSYINKADYIITGEGVFDSMSFIDKAAGVLIKHFKSARIFIICGSFKGNISELPRNVSIFELMKYFKSVEESISKFPDGVKLASGEILKKIFL